MNDPTENEKDGFFKPHGWLHQANPSQSKVTTLKGNCPTLMDKSITRHQFKQLPFPKV